MASSSRRTAGLTALSIKNAKGRDKPYKLTDSDGLFLYVTPDGGRYWRMNYRHMGKQNTLAFGVYPDTGLADAREQRDAARKVLARGDDPAEKIRLDEVAATVAASNSFKAIADEWLVKAERAGRSAVTMKKLRWLLDFINASIGKRPITAISAQELLTMLRKMEGKGLYETAKRLRSTCGQVFRYAIATARAERDIAADLRGALIAPQPAHRAAITSPANAGGLLRAIEAFEGHPTARLRCCCYRMFLSVPVSFATPNGPTSISTRRFGQSRRTRQRCGARAAFLFPPRPSPSFTPSSMTRITADTCSRRSARLIGRCRRTPSTRLYVGWVSRRMK